MLYMLCIFPVYIIDFDASHFIYDDDDNRSGTRRRDDKTETNAPRLTRTTSHPPPLTHITRIKKYIPQTFNSSANPLLDRTQLNTIAYADGIYPPKCLRATIGKGLGKVLFIHMNHKEKGNTAE